MVKKTRGGAARGGKKGGKRDREGGRDSGRVGLKYASGSNALPLGPPDNGLPSANSGQMNSGQQPYSLRDEARDTERHGSALWCGSRLRDNKITFVSAGHFDAKKLMELEPSGTQDSRNSSGLAESLQDPVTQLKDTSEETYRFEDGRPGEADSLMSGYSRSTGVSPPDASETAAEILQDVCGTFSTQPSLYQSGNTTLAGLSPPAVRAPSPTPSDSSQEVILFSGRNQNTNVANEQIARRPTSSGSAFESNSQDASYDILQTGSNSGNTGLGKSSSPEIAETLECIPPSRRKEAIRDGGEDDVIADYIANMKEYGDVEFLIPSGTYEIRDLGLDVEEWQEDETEDEPSTTEGQTSSRKYSACGWGTPDLHRLDAVSTSTDTLSDIESVLAKRSSPNGDHFLVQFKGCSINKAKWISRASLTTENQLKHITTFENVGPEVATYESEDSGDTDEDRKDAKYLRQRKGAAMTAEKLARLFAKQNGLGMASDELEGFRDTDETISDEDLVDDEGLIATSVSKDNRGSQRRGYSSAAQIANAHGDFDIMDFERPSLRKGKGQKTALPFNFSDSELEANILSAWGKDRQKKAGKKRERAELRAQGVLGKYNATNPDVRAKYKQGMTAEEVELEIIRFLASDREQLVFPPMERHQRKMLHEAGAVFNLKSKSVGSKLERFTTLYKTSYTVSNPTDIECAINQIRARGFFPRMGLRSKRGPKPMAAKGSNVRLRRGWTGDSTATYRDGEIVGAAAPELGIENKGRQMLEKMGWSSGTALGALNNKGILQPVASVVKTTKAGLG